ncbi:MAG: damage-inducible protein DinB [Acidimicrobiia bacterium]|nr:damage-inducible protein DinB [Acidimicrobiia bacterium]
MTISGITQDLYRHMEWADACVWRAVMSSDAAMADAATRQRLHHIHAVQRGFLAVWRNEPFDFRAGSSLALEELMAWGRDYHREALQCVAGFSESELDRPIVLPWMGWIKERLGKEPQAPTLGETVLQVASHSTHHRGQALGSLRTHGVEPPLVDFIAWIWLGKPVAAW